MSGAGRSGALTGRRRVRLSVFAAPLAFALVMTGAVGAGLWSLWSVPTESGPAPGVLAGHELDQVTTGPEALAEINQLHGKEIEDVTGGWVAHYHGGGSVWVAAALTEETAKQMVDDMVSGIQKGASPFRGLTALKYGDESVYRVSDGRQLHYFYQQGIKVVWLAAPNGSEEQFLAAAFTELG